jgi:hypothetical protein
MHGTAMLAQMPGDRIHFGTGVPCAVYKDVEARHFPSPRF